MATELIDAASMENLFVFDDVRSYACGTQPCDDMTLVVVKRVGAVPS